jgi:hypothetical protein
MLGVELETDNVSYRHNISHVTNETACGMSKPKGFWITKHDGSVTGPEFASNPATLSWWDMHRDDMEDMFKMLVHAGFRSHDGGNAGMHVNISKEAFTDERHLARFMKMIHGVPAWSIAMAQRTASQSGQWAVLDRYCVEDKAALEGLCRRMLNDYYVTNKYVALNSPEGQRRLEFRLPRGTLRVDRFFKNLQWTQGMIEYTRSLRSLTTATPKKFMQWIEKTPDLYPDLSAFLTEKSVLLKGVAA